MGAGRAVRGGRCSTVECDPLECRPPRVSDMGRCSRLASAALVHVNLLLMVYVGGALVTAARLKWDPSLYVAVRELFPVEYRVSAALLPTVALALLVLAHLVLVALHTHRLLLRRNLLVMYAVGVSLCLAVAAGWATWVWLRVARWCRSQAAQELQHAADVTDQLRPLLEQLAHWHPLPQKLKDIIQEAQQDAPRNLHVLAASGMVLLLLLLTGAALAAGAAAATPAPRAPRSYTQLSQATATWTPLRCANVMETDEVARS
ncbi:unnamed protein product [Leptidea sinapis]|uniref:Uncharacterized protein n=1 Tax=Leptidea sinapis TaxID=189913 RepID=A0A5E4R4Z6_9NEOP|nr:unnamed protein product [Leptidea sinapis]